MGIGGFLEKSLLSLVFGISQMGLTLLNWKKAKTIRQLWDESSVTLGKSVEEAERCRPMQMQKIETWEMEIRFYHKNRKRSYAYGIYCDITMVIL